MSRNGSGVYNLPAGNPVVTGTTITTTWANTTLTDIASSLTGSVASDGQTPMSGNLNMANNKVTALATPTFSTDATTKAYVDAKTDGTLDGSFVNLAYTGTLTGGTGVVNLGSGQFYKDASGNVGLGTTSPSSGGKLSIISAVAQDCAQFTDNTNYTLKITSGGSAVALVTGATGSQLALGANGSERMRIDSSGNLLLGTSGSDSTNKLQVAGRIGATGFANTNGSYAALTASVLQGYPSFGFAQYLTVENSANNSYGMAIYTTSSGSQAERMRIGSSGNLLLGTTTYYGSSAHIVTNTSTAVYGMAICDTASTTGGINFLNSSGTQVGAIYINGASVTYATTSDYRLKENIAPMAGALEIVAKLKPVTYTWKSNGLKCQGFIAHELQEIVPECVSGEKDAMEFVEDLDETGKIIGKKEIPKYQGIDTSFLVATLVAAIQELNAKVTALEAK